MTLIPRKAHGMTPKRSAVTGRACLPNSGRDQQPARGDQSASLDGPRRLVIRNDGGRRLRLTHLTQDGQVLIDGLAGYALGGGFAIVLFYLVVWTLVGRDPPRGTIIPLFGPPDNMSAVAVRYVNQMAFDNKAFTAAIVGYM